MTPATRQNRTRILLAFAAVYFLWGSTFLAIKYAIATIPPFLMGGSRFLLAGAVLFAAASMRGAPRPNASEWRTAAITGVLMIALGNGAVVWSEQSVPSGIVALVVATVPLWIVLIDWLRPHGVRPRPAVFVGLAIGIVGIVFLIGLGALVGHGTLGVGALVVVGGSLTWALGSIITRRSERPRSPLMSTAVQMMAGGIAFLVMAALAGEYGRVSAGSITAASALSWVYLVLAGSLIGFTAYIYLLGAVSPAKAATYAYVNPVIAVLLGWAFGNEPIGARTLVAATIILAGVAIITSTQTNTPSATDEHPLPIRPNSRAA